MPTNLNLKLYQTLKERHTCKLLKTFKNFFEGNFSNYIVTFLKYFNVMFHCLHCEGHGADIHFRQEN